MDQDYEKMKVLLMPTTALADSSADSGPSTEIAKDSFAEASAGSDDVGAGSGGRNGGLNLEDLILPAADEADE